jgi:hypothetical protein
VEARGAVLPLIQPWREDMGFAPWSALVQISAIRDDIRSLVAKLDILTGKVADIDTRLSVIVRR